MTDYEEQQGPNGQARCCPCGEHGQSTVPGVTRRSFLGGAALAGMALQGLSWSALSAGEADAESVPDRRPLLVKPVLIHTVCTRRPQTSWRIWGGIQTEQDAQQELARIQDELAKVQSGADFPVRFLPATPIRNAQELDAVEDLASADVLLLYAAGDYWFSGFADAIARLGKDAIVFSRFMSGPFYSSGTTVSPCLLRGGTNDRLAVEGLDEMDIVIDSQEELLWRLRALCGLRNTIGTRIVAVGGPGGWGVGPQAPALAVDRWKLDIRTVEYKELGELIQAARADEAAVQRAQGRAAEYLKLPGTTLETEKPFVENAFLLEQVFRGLMREADCRAITINGCMATIMPVAETSACLTLSLLNDAGYMAFCESDFVVIPAGILAANIAGRPMFLNDPCYPQHGVIALAHCTAPRMMDGKTREAARIVTHYESDYGAAPKVEMQKGQKVTNLIPDFQAKCLAGFVGEIVDAPFLPICRSQIVVRFSCDSNFLARQMRGYHWITIYGDYLREVEYAIKRTPIAFENLG